MISWDAFVVTDLSIVNHLEKTESRQIVSP